MDKGVLQGTDRFMRFQGFLAGSIVSPRVRISPRNGVEARYRGLSPLRIYAFH